MKAENPRRPNRVVDPDTCTVTGVADETDREVAEFAARALNTSVPDCALGRYWGWEVTRWEDGRATVRLSKD